MITSIPLVSSLNLLSGLRKRIGLICSLMLLLPFSSQAQIESLNLSNSSLSNSAQLSYLYNNLPGTHTLTGSRIDYSNLDLRRDLLIDIGGQSFDVFSMLNGLFVDYVNSGGTLGVSAGSFLLNNMDIFLDPSILLGPSRRSRSGIWPVEPDKATIEHRDNMGRYFDVYFENKQNKKKGN